MYIVSYSIKDISETSQNPVIDHWAITVTLSPNWIERAIFNRSSKQITLVGSNYYWRQNGDPTTRMWRRWAFRRVKNKLTRDLRECE
jgi:hypothetical protein